jgi:hypothetical protein
LAELSCSRSGLTIPIDDLGPTNESSGSEDVAASGSRCAPGPGVTQESPEAATDVATEDAPAKPPHLMAIAVGYFDVCALLDDGTVARWGPERTASSETACSKTARRPSV